MEMVEYYNFLNVSFDYVGEMIGSILTLIVPVVFFFLRKHKEFAKIFKILFFAYLSFAAIMVYDDYSSYQDHKAMQDRLKNNQIQIIEGVITDFVPMPAKGSHDDESFTLNKTSFYYSDYLIHMGFNNTAVHGGPIIEDAYVRIHYVEGPNFHINHILRLEVDQDRLIPVQLKHIKWFKAKEETTENKTQLHLTGKMPFTGYAFDKIDTTTKGDTLTIVPHLKLTERDPYEPDKLDYTIEIKPPVNRVLFGKEREEIWKRQE